METLELIFGLLLGTGLVGVLLGIAGLVIAEAVRSWKGIYK